MSSSRLRIALRVLAVSRLAELDRITSEYFTGREPVEPLDRRALLAQVARLTGCTNPLPPAANDAFSGMTTEKLQRHGWAPGGPDLLSASLPGLIK